MKKALSILLAVLMIASTVAISGIVSASAEAEPVAPVADDDFHAVLVGEGKDVADVHVSNTADTTTEYSVVDIADLGAGYGGTSTTAYLADIKGNGIVKQGMNIKTTETGKGLAQLMFNTNPSIYKITMWVWASTDYASSGASPFVLRLVTSDTVSSGTYIERYVSNNDANGKAELKFAQGWNKIEFVLNGAGNTKRPDIEAVALEVHNASSTAFQFAVADVAISKATKGATKEVTLVDGYADKSVDDCLQISGVGQSGYIPTDFAVEDVNEAGVPVTSAYVGDKKHAAAKAGMKIKVGGEDGIDMSAMSSALYNNELWADTWIYLENPAAYATNLVFRMFESHKEFGGNYIEANLTNAQWASNADTLKAGWNHVIFKTNATNSANGLIASGYNNFSLQQRVRYIAVYNHNNTAAGIVKVGAVKLTSNPLTTNFDLTVTGPTVYRTGDEFDVANYTLTYKGEEVTDFTAGTVDTSVNGFQTIAFNYNGETVNYTVMVKAHGGAIGLTSNVRSQGQSINADNFILGDGSFNFFKAPSNQFVSTIEPGTGVNLIDEDEFVIYALFTADVLKEATFGNWIIELSSTTVDKNNANKDYCVRYLINQAALNRLNLVAGWNRIVIKTEDLLFDPAVNNAIQTTANGFQPNYAHDSEVHKWIDFSGVTCTRMWCDGVSKWTNAGSVILFNGIGYGMDIELNGELAGSDLAEVIARAKDGDTVKLNWDVELDETIVLDKNITLDLNGKKITSTAKYAFVVDGAKVNVVNNTEKYLNCVSAGAASGPSKSYIRTNVDGGMGFRVLGSTDATATDYSVLNLGSNVKVIANYGVAVMGTQVTDRADYRSYGVVVNTEAQFATPGTWAYDGCALFVQGRIQHDGAIPEVNINGGVYDDCNLVDDDDDGYTLCLSGKCNLTINGGTFKGDNVIGYGQGATSANESLASVVVNGGTFYGSNVFGLAKTVPVKSTTVVTGGTFFNDDYKEFFTDEMTVTDTDGAQMAFTGNWTVVSFKNANNKSIYRASKSGSTAEFTFTGTHFDIIGYKSNTYGIVDVAVDGKVVATVDLYSATAKLGTIFAASVENGTHTVTVTSKKEKNANAASAGLFYQAIDAVGVVGTMGKVDTNLADIDVTVKAVTTTIKVDPTVSGVTEAADLAIESVAFGTAEVVNGAIVYTMGNSATDTIVYSVNGFTGTINVTAAQVTIEAENALTQNVAKVWNLAKMSGAKGVGFNAGATSTFTFNGTELTVVGYQSKTYGKFEVVVDGETVGTLDEKVASGCVYKANLGTFTLTEGTHTVVINAIDKVVLDAFIVK